MIDKQKAFEIFNNLKDRIGESDTIHISHCNFGNSTVLMIIIVLVFAVLVLLA